MTERYSVFQKDDSTADAATQRPLRRFGFFGRLLDGTALVAVTLALVVTVFTTGARADEPMMAVATAEGSPLLMLAVLAVFAAMLAAVRRTWMQTARGIARAPRRNHRIG